jgi:hypothetical protein
VLCMDRNALTRVRRHYRTAGHWHRDHTDWAHRFVSFFLTPSTDETLPLQRLHVDVFDGCPMWPAIMLGLVRPDRAQLLGSCGVHAAVRADGAAPHREAKSHLLPQDGSILRG